MSGKADVAEMVGQGNDQLWLTGRAASVASQNRRPERNGPDLREDAGTVAEYVIGGLGG